MNNLLTSFEDGILTITINRPQALNALNQETFAELRQVFGHDALALEGLRGVIVTGAGEKSFVAGADISEFTELDAAKGGALSRNGQEVFFLIERFHVPVVAAVNGFALGGGCELAMACHLRIASENARFGQPEVNLGIIPGYGGTQRLVQMLGKTKALELLLTGDAIKADEALQRGLLNYVVPQAELLDKCRELLNKIATKAPIALTKIIECVNTYYAENGFDREVKEFANMVNTQDFQEGTAAFLEKRKPNFKGE